MLRIWGRSTSICTQRALWALEETGVPYDLILASATMGPNGHVSKGGAPFGIVDTPAYRAMNPNGTVPTIDDDGFVLWESNAIVLYLAAKYAPRQLYGEDLGRLARASQWMSWTNEHLEPHLHTLVMELVPSTSAAGQGPGASGVRSDHESAGNDRRAVGPACLCGRRQFHDRRHTHRLRGATLEAACRQRTVDAATRCLAATPRRATRLRATRGADGVSHVRLRP